MRDFFKLGLLFTLLGTNISIFGAEHLLVNIESNGDPNIYDIGITTDDKTDEVTGLFKIEKTKKDKKVIVRLDYSTKDLKKGIVLVKRQGFNIVSIKSKKMDTVNGEADVSLAVRKNSIWGGKKKYNLEIERNGQEFDAFLNGQGTEKLYIDAGKYGINDVKPM